MYFSVVLYLISLNCKGLMSCCLPCIYGGKREGQKSRFSKVIISAGLFLWIAGDCIDFLDALASVIRPYQGQYLLLYIRSRKTQSETRIWSTLAVLFILQQSCCFTKLIFLSQILNHIYCSPLFLYNSHLWSSLIKLRNIFKFKEICQIAFIIQFDLGVPLGE